MNRRSTTMLAALAAVSFAAASCGSDDENSDSTTAATAAVETTVAAAETTAAVTETTAAAVETTVAAETTAAATETTAAATDTTAAATDTTAASGGTGGEALELDTNGDGSVVIGVATPGPRDDGGYYQALVDGVTAFSEANGFEEPIIVDNIAQEEAASSLDSLARQNVDMIAVGAGEIADPLADLTATYSDIIWYCNCGAGFPPSPNLIQSGDDGAEMGYSAGVATGLLMQDSGATTAAFIGNNNFNFEVEAFMSFELGLMSVDETFTATYVATGSFNDVAAATEAFNNLKDQGVGAIWPYLGGAHEAVVKLANENEIITMSAGASDVCERTDLDYQIAVRFDAGDYLDTILAEILDGKLQRGDTRKFTVGVDPQGGAVICDPTPEQQTAMDDAFALIASGDLAEEFGAIKGEAYGG